MENVKKVDNILGKILALTKEFHLKEPPNGSGFSRQFFTGRRTPLSLTGSFGLKWWLTRRGFTICEDIANMAMTFDPKLKGADRVSFCNVIEDVFQKNALELFDVVGSIFSGRAKTLFEARSIIKEREFALQLWNKIHHALADSMIGWLVLYPLHRINTQSTVLGFDGLSLLESNDLYGWIKLSERYTDTKYWDPSTGMRKDAQDHRFFGTFPSTWLACEVTGTSLGARKLAERCMRTFLAVLFSHIYSEVPNLLKKSMEQEISYSIQFPNSKTQTGQGQICAHIGSLLPPLIIDVNISPNIISELKDWYKLLSSASKEKMNRAKLASHFIHYGIISDDLERFLHFYIALDALFGVRDNVEKRITIGIKKTFQNDLTWEERAEGLFDLRNELVHGGSSLVDDWDRLDHYRQHFRSHPLEDVGIAAMSALQKYFKL